MNAKIPRREFIKAVPVAAWAVSQAARSVAAEGAGTGARTVLETFEYNGVKLLPSRWLKQYQAARDFWLSLSEEDILHGYRAAAGLPSPGKALGGWCRANSNTVFGQWLSGMARMSRATNDTEIRDKAVRLFTEWAKTVKDDGDCGMRHYPFEKLVCGLVDLQVYADFKEAGAMLERVVDFAAKNFNHDNAAAVRGTLPSGRPSEWYTLAENLYRAYQVTGNAKYKTFGDVWLYPAFWDQFADSAAPPNAYGFHGYSHVNTFSSAAMAYAVTNDRKYLNIIKNAYDWLQNYQCYATGGYGPSETIVGYKGALGQVLEVRSDTFETACGAWAGFKLGRYLMGFTGEARYGDWIEKLLYNGIGAALPVTKEGKTFYYSDYRIGGGTKVYYWDAWPCCAGSYIQAVADYYNIIYFKDATSLYVNLFVPSEVTWKRADGEVKLKQETNYPEAETSTLTLELPRETKFALKFRVPDWTRDVSVKVNGADLKVEAKPGTWASLERAWKTGDTVELRVPLRFRMEAVDKQHPERVAVVRGPVAMVMEGLWQETSFTLPKTDAEFEELLITDRMQGYFQVRAPGGGINHSKFRPFYSEGEGSPYYMYFDKQALPVVQW